jgi:serine/threonine-protein kinase
MADDWEQLRPGTIIDGHYLLEEKVGEGAMGEVWRATEISLQRLVALKFPSSEQSEIQRFVKEGVNLAQVQSVHVTTVYRCAVTGTGGLPYIAMEWLSGRDLSKELVMRGRLPAVEVIEYGLQISAGLAALHTAKIVHRDIKPSNIYLVDGPSGRVVKLIDLGVARRLATASTRLTQKGMVVGTLAYMSPEQLTGQTVDARTDIWSTGMVLLEALSGALPFAADATDSEVIGAIVTRSFTLPSLPSGLHAALAGCLADREVRFQSAAELTAALRRAVNVTPPTITSTVDDQLVTEGPPKTERAGYLHPPGLDAAAGMAKTHLAHPLPDRNASQHAGTERRHPSRLRGPLIALAGALAGVATLLGARCAIATADHAPAAMPDSIETEAMPATLCSEGQSITADTQGHCCWEGQSWNTGRGACVGTPSSCPAGLVVVNDKCGAVLLAPPSAELPAPDCLPLGSLDCQSPGHPCCAGDADILVCGSTKSEPKPHCCRPVNSSCTDGADCCGYTNCVEGKCACVANGMFTLKQSDCCSGSMYETDNHEGERCCGVSGGPCSDDDGCCGQSSCKDGTCT